MIHSFCLNEKAIDYSLVSVSCSGQQNGKIDGFIWKENIFCWTANRKFSWYQVSFHEDYRVYPTHYSLKYGSSANYCVPRYWKLQASNDVRVLNEVHFFFLCKEIDLHY